MTGSIGVVALAASMEGYFLRTASWFERALFLAAALLLIDPSADDGLIGLGLLAVGLLIQKLRAARSTVAERSEHVTRAQLIALTLIAAAVVAGRAGLRRAAHVRLSTFGRPKAAD